MRELTLGQARRIALAAQGFDTPRLAPGTVTTRALLRVLERVGCVQVDSVNVLVRSHYLPFFARLGGYDLALLDRLRDDAPRRVVEYWAHEASLLPVAQWPLHGHRMRDAAERAWGRMRRIEAEHPGLADAVEHLVRAQGPLTARQVEAALTHPAAGLARPREHWGWNWSHAKVALEWLFWCGRISSAGRTAQFERRYAAPEHVAPPAHRAAWTDPARAVAADAAYRHLVEIAARACGVATEASLADYFRLDRRPARAAIEHLVADGVLEPVTVAGWPRAAYLHGAARIPRRLHVAALVSPFDSLVWHRERTEGLFGVRYRIEIYTPAAQRVHGYYVLPFVFGDTIVARADLKADRRAGVLRVPQVTWEPAAPPGAPEALAEELRTMAAWLGLTDVVGAQLGVSLRG